MYKYNGQIHKEPPTMGEVYSDLGREILGGFRDLFSFEKLGDSKAQSERTWAQAMAIGMIILGGLFDYSAFKAISNETSRLNIPRQTQTYRVYQHNLLPCQLDRLVEIESQKENIKNEGWKY
jgi:hypothetical protein